MSDTKDTDTDSDNVATDHTEHGPTFRISPEADGSWLARPVGTIRGASDGRLVRGWNDVNTLRREWRAQAHWSAADHARFVAEFGDPRNRSYVT